MPNARPFARLRQAKQKVRFRSAPVCQRLPLARVENLAADRPSMPATPSRRYLQCLQRHPCLWQRHLPPQARLQLALPFDASRLVEQTARTVETYMGVKNLPKTDTMFTNKFVGSARLTDAEWKIIDERSAKYLPKGS